jgi:hypothetical protein
MKTFVVISPFQGVHKRVSWFRPARALLEAWATSYGGESNEV